MHILGISNGTPGGNSEILLKAALLSACKHDSSITVSMIHAPSASIPYNAAAMSGAQDISNGIETKTRAELSSSSSSLSSSNNTSNPSRPPRPDDRPAIYDAVVSADAIILSTPVYSHQPRGTLKAMLDSILGPFTDVAFATRIKAGKEARDSKFADMSYDERLLRPKIAAFLAVAGSAEQLEDQWTMALPTLHTMVYSMYAKVVDQVVLPGCIGPGAVFLNDGAAIKRAELLGSNVASQIGRVFDEALFLGHEEVGACPYCHLLKIEFRKGQGVNDVRCIVCGAEGCLVLREDGGGMRPVWEVDSGVSSLTMKGKIKHLDDISGLAKMQSGLLTAVKEGLELWRAKKLPVVELPSFNGRS